MGKVLSQEDVRNRIKSSFKQDVDLIGLYINRRTPVKLKCNECSYEWEAKPQSFLYGENHFCPKCNDLKQQVNCSFCGKEFYRTSRSLNTESGYVYCSKECGNRHKNQLRKESGEWEDSSNYRLKAFDKYEHKCAVCGWNEDERILEVHHIDENHSNNDINNLCILCPICHRKITLGYYKLNIVTKKLEKNTN